MSCNTLDMRVHKEVLPCIHLPVWMAMAHLRWVLLCDGWPCELHAPQSLQHCLHTHTILRLVHSKCARVITVASAFIP